MSVSVPLDVFDAIPGAAAAVVTPSGGVAVSSTVQWFQEEASPADQAVGAGVSSALSRRVVAYVRRDQVTNLPVGSVITGGPAHHQKAWKVVSVDASDPEYHVAAVI